MSPILRGHARMRRRLEAGSLLDIVSVVGPEPALTVPAGGEEHETHASIVRLIGDRAYKRRKPVRFPFLDQSTAALRHALASEELRINQALAPDTYLAVRSVRGDACGDWLVGSEAPVAPDEEVVVEMRRFAQADTLARRLSNGRVSHHDLGRLGRLLARYHRDLPAEPGGGVRATLARLHRNVEELAELLAGVGTAEELARIARPLEMFCLRRADELDRRARAGRWREGHGDLRAEHVVMDDRGLRIVDRVEFDPDLRVDDVAADLAFLLMDLEANDAAWAAEQVLWAYRRDGGDVGDDALLSFWGAYRASVTAKVALLRARQPGGTAAVELARRRLELARRLAWRTRLPIVLVVCGPPACGKSTLASVVQHRTGLPVLSSDRVRKRLHGVRARESAPPWAYTAAASVEVYQELGRRAAAVLASHGGVIVDATMGSAAGRLAFGQAIGARAPTVFVQCEVPAGTAVARAAARERDPRAESDATAAIASNLRRAWEPLDEIAADRHLLLRADRDAELVADDLELALDRARGPAPSG